MKPKNKEKIKRLERELAVYKGFVKAVAKGTELSWEWQHLHSYGYIRDGAVGCIHLAKAAKKGEEPQKHKSCETIDDDSSSKKSASGGAYPQGSRRAFRAGKASGH